MKRGTDIKKAYPIESTDFVVAVLGAGAAAPVAPANGLPAPTTGTFPIKANALSVLATEIPTRASAGLYTITYDQAFMVPAILDCDGSVISAGASPTACLQVAVTIVNAATRQITCQVSTPAGVATDLGTSDMLVLSVGAWNTTG